MIDYEKLKIAHELAINNKLRLVLTMSAEIYHELYIDGKIQLFDDLDELINRLQELTKPKPKYKIYDKVWRLNDEYKPRCVLIAHIDYDNDTHVYADTNEEWWLEEQLYPSKEALIQAQLDYWNSLLEAKQ